MVVIVRFDLLDEVWFAGEFVFATLCVWCCLFLLVV